MHLFERIYRSPLGRLMSFAANILAGIHKPLMFYGFKDPATGIFHKYSRISSSAIIMNRERLSIGDFVWIWHYSILDATEGLKIGEGCQIGAWVGIFTHGSENSIRLLGKQFVHIPNQYRKGYSRGAVTIGDYSFIGAGTMILPGVSIGKGCLIGAGSLVSRDIPDYSVAIGQPAEVRGSTIDIDQKFFERDDFTSTYYDEHALEIITSRMTNQGNRQAN